MGLTCSFCPFCVIILTLMLTQKIMKEKKEENTHPHSSALWINFSGRDCWLFYVLLLWRKRLLIRSKVLQSKAMMLVSRLPSIYFLSSLFEFWSYRPCNYDNYFYSSSMQCFPLMMNFTLLMYVLCMLPLFMQHFVLVVIWIAEARPCWCRGKTVVVL